MSRNPHFLFDPIILGGYSGGDSGADGVFGDEGALFFDLFFCFLSADMTFKVVRNHFSRVPRVHFNVEGGSQSLFVCL